MRRAARAAVVAAVVLAACSPAGSASQGDPTVADAASTAGDRSDQAGAWSEETVDALPSVRALASEPMGDAVDADETETPAAGDRDVAADAAGAAGAGVRPRPEVGLVAVAPGTEGDGVEALQRRLDRLGFAPGPVDGAYGPRTEAAVGAFQQLAGLKRTGRANARTVAALEDYQSDVKILRAGDKGRAVKRLQRRLAGSPLDPGPVDGAYGPRTVQAVWALEKLAGVPVDGNWGPLDEHAMQRLENGELAQPSAKHRRRWVEFDLSQQVMTVYDPGSSAPVLISHGSSGSGIPWQNENYRGNSITPPGEFVISRRIAGWRESSLDIGRLYNPLYFNGGIAFHGALSVPLYPASHGCVRLPMHIAEYLPDELPNGTPVHVVQ